MAAIVIPAGEGSLRGDLIVPPGATGIVVIADDGRYGVRHPALRRLARHLRSIGFATLLLDLSEAGHAPLPPMTECLRSATEWLARGPESWQLRPGYLVAGRAAGAALMTAAARPRPTAPTLLLAGADDGEAVGLGGDRHLRVVSGRYPIDSAETSRLVTDWFRRHLC